MNTFMKSVSMLAVAAMAGMSITSCTADKNLYDPEQAEKNVKAEYAANFVKKFGAVSATENWDRTAPSSFTLPIKSTKATRTAEADGNAPTITEGDFYGVEGGTLAWLNDNLEESVNNRSKGIPFTLRMPGNSFTIVPIYVGQGGFHWDFHMVTVDTDNRVKYDQVVWSKGQPGTVQIKANADSNWTDLGYGTTIGAHAVQAKTFTVDNMEPGAIIYFYLKITFNNNSDNWALTGAEQSSLAQMMVALDNVPRPRNIDPKKDVMIIGCEDADGVRSDWDMNDVVFLVYGNDRNPDIIDVEDVVETKSARYMIEDLGATDDFDFNDIVIDAQQQRNIRYKIVNRQIVPEETVIGPWKQQATLKHLGGTLPYQVKIGDTTLPWNEPALGQDMDLTTEITGWDPYRHNISATVKGKNGGYVEIPFPKQGEVPMIIAMKPTKQWMSERSSITPEWFNE